MTPSVGASQFDHLVIRSSASHVDVQIPHRVRMCVPNCSICDWTMRVAIDIVFAINSDTGLLHHVYNVVRTRSRPITIDRRSSFGCFFLGLFRLVLTVCLSLGNDVR